MNKEQFIKLTKNYKPIDDYLNNSKLIHTGKNDFIEHMWNSLERLLTPINTKDEAEFIINAHLNLNNHDKKIVKLKNVNTIPREEKDTDFLFVKANDIYEKIDLAMGIPERKKCFKQLSFEYLKTSPYKRYKVSSKCLFIDESNTSELLYIYELSPGQKFDAETYVTKSDQEQYNIHDSESFDKMINNVALKIIKNKFKGEYFIEDIDTCEFAGIIEYDNDSDYVTEIFIGIPLTKDIYDSLKGKLHLAGELDTDYFSDDFCDDVLKLLQKNIR